MIKHFKRLANQIAVYGLGDIISKIAAILILPIFSHYLSPADYGVVAILTVTNSLIIGLTDLGLTNGVFRFFYDEEEKNRGKLISTAQIACATIPFILAIVAMIFAKPISLALLGTDRYAYLVAINFLSIPLNIISTVPLARLRMEERAKLYSTITISKIIVGILLNVVLVVLFSRGVAGLIEGQLITALVFAVIIGIYSLIFNGVSFSRPLFSKMFIFGFPFVLSLTAFWVMDWADRFILQRMTNLSEVGLYNLGYALGMAIMLPVGAFATAWPPFYMSISKQENAKQIYSLVLTYYSLAIGFMVLLLAVFSRDYFVLTTPSIYHSAYIVVPLIALAYALKGHFLIGSVGSFLEKRPILQVWAEIGAVIINVILMIILIPFIGRMGAAWATIAAYIFLPLAIIALTHKFYTVNYEYGRIIKITLTGLLLYLACEFIYAPGFANIVIRLGIILCYPLILYIMGFFAKNELSTVKNIFAKVANG